jgi:hypothetical protein
VLYTFLLGEKHQPKLRRPFLINKFFLHYFCPTFVTCVYSLNEGGLARADVFNIWSVYSHLPYKKIYEEKFGHRELLPYLCETITENHMDQETRNRIINTQSKIETLLMNKLKSSEVFKFDSYYGNGEVIVKKLKVRSNSNGRPCTLQVELVYHGTIEKRRWETPQSIGRRRNDEIRNAISWRDNHIKTLAKVFGISYIEVEKITLKKK